MKILYAIQGTGNGHVSRAREVIPQLALHGQVTVAVSGNQSQVPVGSPVTYHSDGLSFVFGRSGGIDYFRSAIGLHPLQFISDVRNFPVQLFDLIVNDFEPVSAWAAKLRGAPSVAFSHQAAFLSPHTPRPKIKNYPVELIFRAFAPCKFHIGLHFQSYDENIRTPVIRSEVSRLAPEDQGHYTVYLPAYHEAVLTKLLHKIPQVRWQVFSRSATEKQVVGNVTTQPISNEAYLESMATCTGVITGGGFEGPAEALFLKKKLLVVPMKGHYEQQCNALALQKLTVPVIPEVNDHYHREIAQWADAPQRIEVNYKYHLDRTVEELLARAATSNKLEESLASQEAFALAKQSESK